MAVSIKVRPEPLTLREEQVLRLTAMGHPNKAIAALLGISAKTVDSHKGNGMRKLELNGRAELVRHAAHHGWFADL
jgi:DNA-binding CsgD family transcriptional regulator